MANETLQHSLARSFSFGFSNERSSVDLCKKGVKAIVLGPETSERENKEASERKYNLVFKTLSAHKIQIDSFDFGERLTRETRLFFFGRGGGSGHLHMDSSWDSDHPVI